ncbi:MAG TPA: DUF3037 domain-containing protein [Candidatus Acidoferrum sp.]
MIPGLNKSEDLAKERPCAYRVLRYTPNLVRDEWVNIGVLVFDPETGERRLRLIEDQDEYSRVRRLHPAADEALLRALRDEMESRFEAARELASAESGGANRDWQKVLEKWDNTLSNALQLAPQKGVLAGDLDAEVERLYSDHVAVPRAGSRVGAPGSRGTIRSYCAQVFKQARVWDRLDKSVHASEFTFPGDPMRLDYSYRRNGTRGFVQTLSVTRAPADAKLLAYTVERIHAKARLATEFAAVTDVPLTEGNDRHRFVRDTLRDVGIEPVPMEGFAVWVAKLRPMIQ